MKFLSKSFSHLETWVVNSQMVRLREFMTFSIFAYLLKVNILLGKCIVRYTYREYFCQCMARLIVLTVSTKERKHILFMASSSIALL